MDKRIILSVAGSGKTKYIIDKLNVEERSLVLTYTNNNFSNIKDRIINKFGCLPSNITVLTYFQFLISFCYKPYLNDIRPYVGITWDTPDKKTLTYSRDNSAFYYTSSNYLYSNRIAKLFEALQIDKKIIHRIEKFYDNLFIDEIQDLGGHDFNLILSLCAANINIYFVGDFYQHTYDTSNDGNTNANLYKSYEKYGKKFSGAGLLVDTTTLSKSYRCTENVCAFIRDNMGIEIYSNKASKSEVHFIDDEEIIDEIVKDNEIVKLFLQKHYSYKCHSMNWGKSKGINEYQDVCVSLYPKALSNFHAATLDDLAPRILRGLYVACTRANRNLYLVDQAKLVKYKI